MRRSLRLRDWQRAQDLVRRWEAEGSAPKSLGRLRLKRRAISFLLTQRLGTSVSLPSANTACCFASSKTSPRCTAIHTSRISMLIRFSDSGRLGRTRMLRRGRSLKHSAHFFGLCMRVVGFRQTEQAISNRRRSQSRQRLHSLGRLPNRNEGYTVVHGKRRSRNCFQIKKKEWWRRGESNC